MNKINTSLILFLIVVICVTIIYTIFKNISMEKGKIETKEFYETTSLGDDSVVYRHLNYKGTFDLFEIIEFNGNLFAYIGESFFNEHNTYEKVSGNIVELIPLWNYSSTSDEEIAYSFLCYSEEGKEICKATIRYISDGLIISGDDIDLLFPGNKKTVVFEKENRIPSLFEPVKNINREGMVSEELVGTWCCDNLEYKIIIEITQEGECIINKEYSDHSVFFSNGYVDDYKSDLCYSYLILEAWPMLQKSVITYSYEGNVLKLSLKSKESTLDEIFEDDFVLEFHRINRGEHDIGGNGVSGSLPFE